MNAIGLGNIFKIFLWEKKKVTDFLRAFHITIKVVLKLS